jgi:hypothetical protein
VSLTDFQRAFSDLIASPRLVLRARSEPAAALAGYDLTERERQRLAAMCASEAMEINCTLYRVNRLTPIYSVLSRTCHLLGPALASELLAFWEVEHDATLQFHRQSVRFAEWLRERRHTAALPGGPWEDALRFELAVFEARTAPHDGDAENPADARLRWIDLHYDPSWLLAAEPTEAPTELLAEPVWLCIDATGPELEIRSACAS